MRYGRPQTGDQPVGFVGRRERRHPLRHLGPEVAHDVRQEQARRAAVRDGVPGADLLAHHGAQADG